MTDKCPVDHPAPAAGADACPVDHTTRSTWSTVLSHPSSSTPSTPAAPSSPPTPLSTARETSSIPRGDGEPWVYPSESQFFAAMARKHHNPQAPDMKVIVPIHNAVNERAWGHVLAWERGRGGAACGGVRLVSFKGRPRDLTPKARLLTLVGCVARLVSPLYFFFFSFLSVRRRLRLSPLRAGTRPRLTGTTGSSTAAAPASAMSSTFIPGAAPPRARPPRPSSSTSAPPSTAGRASKCAWAR